MGLEWTYATGSSTADTACLVLVLGMLMLATHGRGRVQSILLFAQQC